MYNKVIKGQLGHSAKVSPGLSHQTTHVICVYTPNFNDYSERMRIHGVLADHGLNSKSFKPDIFTCLGLDKQNRWRLPSTLTKDYKKPMEQTIETSEVGLKKRKVIS